MDAALLGVPYPLTGINVLGILLLRKRGPQRPDQRRFVPAKLGRVGLFGFFQLASSSCAVIATAIIAFTTASTMSAEQPVMYTLKAPASSPESAMAELFRFGTSRRRRQRLPPRRAG